jgi:adenylate kinase family enzyme
MFVRTTLTHPGCPGSGKGTLCKLLAQEYRYQHISVGDLLRSIRDDPTNEDFELRDHVRQGTLVPTRTIVRILKEAISGGLASGSGVIVDGFPRHLDQGIALMEQVRTYLLIDITWCVTNISAR